MRDDILLKTGGKLEQTSKHATSSSVSIRVPVASDNIQECDYIVFKENNETVFAGTILKKEQETLQIFPDWRDYKLTIAGNSDLVSNIFVDLTFPEGASITQILFGNHPGSENYDSNFSTFYGIFEMRIETEEITLGTVDNFSDYKLSDPAYLWGRYVSDVLDDLCGVASAWWEITPDRVFNMAYTAKRTPAPFNIDENSEVFKLNVSKDALTLYSGCRVIGGKGQSRKVSNISVQGLWVATDTMSIWQKDDKTLVSETALYSIGSVRQLADGQTPSDPASPEIIKVGYKGIHDDDPAYQALISVGGNEIALKDGYKWVLLVPNSDYYTITVQNIIFYVDVYARIIDPNLANEIAQQRGGTGVIEYTLEDNSIKDFGTAVATAQSFLNNHAQRAVEISFSTFSKGLQVGQVLTINLPYYSIFGNYQITKVSATSILEQENVIWQYDVTASNVDYRDPYHDLWYKPVSTSFTLDSDQPATDGIYLDNAVKVKTYITAYGSEQTTWSSIQKSATSWTIWEQIYPSWQQLQSPTSPYTWSELEQMFLSWEAFEKTVTSWAWLERIELGWYYLGNYLTPHGRQRIVDFISQNSPVQGINLFGSLLLSSETGSPDVYEPQDVSLTENGGTATYMILPGDSNYLITKMFMTDDGTANGEKILSANVNIDHRSSGNPRGLFSITVAVRTTIE